MNLNGKSAIVTGGDNGNLGPLWTRFLQEWGAEVFTIDLPKYDVADYKSVLRAYIDCIDTIGVPDIIVNNAAIDPKPKGKAQPWDNFAKTIGVNLIGAGYVIEAFMTDMVRRGSGLIVNIGSILGFGAADHRNYEPGFAKPFGYNVSKAGLYQLTKSVGVFYGQYGIRSVMLALGPVESDLWAPEFREKILRCLPSGRFVTEADCKAGLQVCIEADGFNGREILIDCGYTAW